MTRSASLPGPATRTSPAPPVDPATTVLTIGRRIRHARIAQGDTLDDLAEKTGIAASQLSLIENGHREPRLTLLQQLGAALAVEVADLLKPAAPSKRDALEIRLDALQRSQMYASLKLPTVKASRKLPLEALEALVGLHDELARRSSEASATPAEARRANTALRREMRAQNNYLEHIETAAEELLAAVGHPGGPLTHRTVQKIVEHLGFTLHHAPDLPTSTRSVTDLENKRIYLPPQSIPGGHGLRSLALQAIAHRVLGHTRPRSYEDFLRQRTEITYFAASCLMPLTPALAFLQEAKSRKDLAVEDFRDAFGVTHESAAHRFTNLATAHLGIPLHFLRVHYDGTLLKGYENDDVNFPTDVTGAIEGQIVCRNWTSRTVFAEHQGAGEFHQYTDTPSGTFWCSAQTGRADDGDFSITLGVPYAHAKWFRGRDTTDRSVSHCPDPTCCKEPAPDLASQWREAAWPSAKLHTHILSALPAGTFPGVDDAEVYEFLARHSG